ncbi:hypothetical protein C8R46DRAFT_1329556 [Mycena filopes]|nr:hypothetical protein C8R46DRAFT_1329556 [Mycena filopes]
MDPSTDYLLFLPAELWLACWTLCSCRQLRRLSLTCRLFRSLTFPLLLHDQSFDVVTPMYRLNTANWMERARYFHRAADRLDKLRQPPYVESVRSWKVVLDNGYIPLLRSPANAERIRVLDDIYRRVATTFSATFGRYNRLTSLHIQHFTILPLVGAIASLSSLDELRLDNCHITEALRDLKLRTLGVSGLNPVLEDAESLPIASPAVLRNLFVDSQLPQLITGFGAQKMQVLVQLSVQVVRQVEQFFSFLERCPQLESLVVNGFYRDTTLPRSVAAETIPRLRSLAGPPALMSLLAPGRPLTTARISRDYGRDGGLDAAVAHLLLTACSNIARSSAALHSLHLPHPRRSPDDFFGTIIPLFTADLRELVITIPVSTFFGCGRNGDPGADGKVEVGEKLQDEQAFDDLPEDELSDTEAEEKERHAPPPFIVHHNPSAPRAKSGASSGTKPMHTILDWILSETVSSPLRNLEVLSMEAGEGLWLELFSETEQHQAIAALLTPCPRLQHVRFGPVSSGWRRVGEVWRSETGSCIRIVAEE